MSEQEARENLMETLWHGNAPGIDYYGPNDEKWNAAAQRCKAENAAELDAYRTAIRQAAFREAAQAVEGLRETHDGWCYHNTGGNCNCFTTSRNGTIDDALARLASLGEPTP